VLDGRLSRGEPVPPTRELAATLGVSRNTVAVAYDRLVAEGFLDSRVGAGTFVNADSEGVYRPLPRTTLRARPVWGELTDPADPGAVEFDLRPGLPDARLFPHQAWRRSVARHPDDGRYGDPRGSIGARTAIAAHIATSRSVRATADDVVVTQGAQQALDLAGRVLLEPGDAIAVEDPGYPPARRLFASLGARVIPVPVDADGLVVSAIPADARAVYVTPSHQYPLGMPMTLARRVALVRWAEERDAAVIEDDYDSEFRFGGRAIEPLHSLDRIDGGGRVLYIGSFSSTLLPALRLGFLIAPASLATAARLAKQLTDRQCALPAQDALANFIDEGLFARHLRRMRIQYQARRECVLAILQRDFGEWLMPIRSVAGLHVAARLRGRTFEDTAVTQRLRAAGVAMTPLSPLYAGRKRAGLVIGYGAVDPAEISHALARLHEILAQ
jgi:GntR family transcriptional regulator/MocR family aminotransferase